MPRNSSGVYTLPQSAFTAGTTISSAAVNSDLSDIATALTGSLPVNGSTGMTGQLKLPDGSISAPALSFSNELTTGFNRPTSGEIGVVIGGSQIGYFNSAGFQGPGSTPIGSVMPFCSESTPPSLWYLCYGQAVSRTTYSLLYSVLGTTWGSGDGSTTFNLPDLRGYVPAGPDNMGGSAAGRLPGYGFGGAGGNYNFALTTGNVPPHTHGYSGTTASDSPAHTHNYNFYPLGNEQVTMSVLVITA
jgi:microcystin-dependent protein